MKYTLSSRIARLTMILLICISLLTLAGLATSRINGRFLCNGWPFCVPTNIFGWLKLVHIALAAVSAIMMSRVLAEAWRRHANDRILLPLATVTTILFLGQALVGAMQVIQSFPLHLVILHTLTAVSLWIALLALVVVSGLRADEKQNFQKCSIPAAAA